MPRRAASRRAARRAPRSSSTISRRAASGAASSSRPRRSRSAARRARRRAPPRPARRARHPRRAERLGRAEQQLQLARALGGGGEAERAERAGELVRLARRAGALLVPRGRRAQRDDGRLDAATCSSTPAWWRSQISASAGGTAVPGSLIAPIPSMSASSSASVPTSNGFAITPATSSARSRASSPGSSCAVRKTTGMRADAGSARSARDGRRAVHLRHLDVEQDRVRQLGAGERHRLGTRRRTPYLPAGLRFECHSRESCTSLESSTTRIRQRGIEAVESAFTVLSAPNGRNQTPSRGTATYLGRELRRCQQPADGSNALAPDRRRRRGHRRPLLRDRRGRAVALRRRRERLPRTIVHGDAIADVQEAKEALLRPRGACEPGGARAQQPSATELAELQTPTGTRSGERAPSSPPTGRTTSRARCRLTRGTRLIAGPEAELRAVGR